MTLPTILSFAWLSAVVILASRALGQGRNLRMLEPTVYLPEAAEAPSVAVIVPARNEAANIAPCLAALLDQSYPAAAVSVVAVDDNSEDDTGAQAAALAAGDERLRVVSCPPLPPGWFGKSHACAFGVQWAQDDAMPEWLCFTDADTRAGPDLLATAMAEAETRGLDLISLLPRQHFAGFAERLVMPCGLYILSVHKAPARVQAGGGDAVIATGQFILVRRTAYECAGGHAAVRDDVAEDVALAERVGRCGFRVALASGDQLYAVRMYSGWRSLWYGVSKNLVEMLGGHGPTLLIGCSACLFGWLAVALPVVTAVGCFGSAHAGCTAFDLAGVGTAIVLAFHVGGALLFELPLWYCLLFPLGYTVVALLAADSVRRRAMGRTQWKGRVYPRLDRPRPAAGRARLSLLRRPRLD